MTDPLTWSINLGRWSGTQVRVSILLVLFLIGKLLGALLAKQGQSVLETIAWLTLLLIALALHELGHAVMASRLGCDLEEIRFWPLGSLVGPSPSAVARPSDSFLVALAGPVTSAGIALVTAIGLNFAKANLEVNPFAGGAPIVGKSHAAPFSTVWWIGWFGHLNWVLFLANLIPALPLDGGRMLRSSPLVGHAKDSMIAPMTARSCAAILLLVGLARLFFLEQSVSGGWALILLAVLIEWTVRTEARMLEDGGFFEDGVFGYDFSEGYTSLEGNVPKVRPYRESALKRWRRRRSELRRQRRQAQEVAEERRMDEILEKLHREGRAALTEEEHRFLIRVSAKYKNKPKNRG